MSRVLVTGAGGFVGRYTMRAVARTMRPGDRLAGIGREPMTDLPAGTEGYEIDLLDVSALRAFVADFRPTHVLHLAALSSVHEATRSASRAWRGNFVGLLNLAEALIREAAGSTFYFVSSGEVYGRAFLSGTPVAETALPQPANVYARTKLAGELMLGDVLPDAGIKLIVLRPFNHVGAGQAPRFVVASLAGQIARIESGQSPAVLEVGDLSAERDFLDVRDVVDAYLSLIAHSDGLADGSIYNVSSGRARSIAEILDALKSRARVSFEVRVSAERLRPSEIPKAVGNPSALEAAIGWRPGIPWHETLDAVLDDARFRLATEQA